MLPGACSTPMLYSTAPTQHTIPRPLIRTNPHECAPTFAKFAAVFAFASAMRRFISSLRSTIAKLKNKIGHDQGSEHGLSTGLPGDDADAGASGGCKRLAAGSAPGAILCPLALRHVHRRTFRFRSESAGAGAGALHSTAGRQRPAVQWGRRKRGRQQHQECRAGSIHGARVPGESIAMMASHMPYYHAPARRARHERA